MADQTGFEDDADILEHGTILRGKGGGDTYLRQQAQSEITVHPTNRRMLTKHRVVFLPAGWIARDGARLRPIKGVQRQIDRLAGGIGFAPLIEGTGRGSE